MAPWPTWPTAPTACPPQSPKPTRRLKGYLALRLSAKAARKAGDILRGQVAVALYDNGGALLDATGVQTAYVLDSLYAGKASTRAYGATFGGDRPAYRLWAPTAQTVALLTWAPTAAADAPVSEATRTPMERAGDGSWSAQAGARNARYLYEVTVFAPTTGKVETTLVTDPYSVALTLNSTRSVAVDLRDRPSSPELWRATPSPKLAHNVDSTIYELHVRDFSVRDKTVSEENRGSYLAFAEDGDGTKHLKALADGPEHRAPAADLRHRLDRGGPGPAGHTRLRPGVVRPLTARSSRPASRRCAARTPSTGATTRGTSTPPRARTRRRQRRPTVERGSPSSAPWSAACTVTACGSSSTRCSTTAASGQDAKSVLDRVVPGYYHRLNASGAVETSTCCQNIATEHQMAQKLMVDSVVLGARDYKVDGFRFDLMGHHSREHARGADGSRRPDGGEGRRRRSVRLPLRRGLELR